MKVMVVICDQFAIFELPTCRYTGQHDRAMRTINELKKILEIEGLLDKYSRMLARNRHL